jgi:hypothetical protein
VTRRLLTLQFVALLCAIPAWAQAPRSSGPFSGLFGGPARAGHSLDFRGSLFAVDQKVFVPSTESEAVALDPRFQQGGTFGGASGTLAYSYDRKGDGSGFFVNSRASVSDYSVSPTLPDFGFDLGTGVTTRLTRRIEFGTRATASFAPFFSFVSPNSAPTGFDTGVLAFDPTFGIPSFGFAVAAQKNITLDGSMGITASLTRRASVSVQGKWREMRLLDRPDNDVRTYGGGATFRYRLTRTISLRAGYGRELTQYLGSTAAPTRSDSIEAALDYGDSLTLRLGRRATLSFNPAVTVIHYLDQNYFRLNGTVVIARGFGRTWNASAAYVRSMQFVGGSTQPVLSDSVFASLGGQLLPRLTWTSGAGAAHGNVGFSTSAPPFTTYRVSSGVSFALFRSMGSYAQYNYQRAEISPGSTTLDVLSSFRRHTFSVGLSLWVPIINNGKGTRDSR